VQEYWIVDPETDAVTVYRRLEGRYERTAYLTAAADNVLTTPLLPGLEIPLARVFGA
jgi:Uma2 family endonuclease